MFLANSNGGTAPPAYLVTDKGIPEGKFIVREVLGLSADNIASGKGYLYFCSSRAGNAALCRDFCLTVVLPTIAASAQLHSAKVSI